jgi:hypothetical protein
MTDEQIAEIVRQVVAQLTAQFAGRMNGHEQRRVLALFSGASAGQHEGLETVRQLCQAGHQVTAVLSSGGSYLLEENRLQDTGVQTVLKPGAWIDSPGLVRGTELVLVPTLSMNFAAHLALGLLDSPAATLVTGALLAGKPVIAIRDGADPDGAGGQVFGANGGAPMLRARLQSNLKTLETYGVELVSQQDFAAAVQKRIGSTKKQNSMLALQPFIARAAEILTQADVANLPVGSILHLAPGSRLSPLAAETLSSRRIQVVWEE